MILSRIISEIPTLSLMDVSLIRQTECSSLTTFSLSLSQPDLQKSTFPLPSFIPSFLPSFVAIVALRRRFVLINNENGNVCRARRSQWRFTILTRSRGRGRGRGRPGNCSHSTADSLGRHYILFSILSLIF